ncbi:hypothetical protein [Vibrio breoganii]|uniref:hypothetical protein n=1 Tax=Vibrio breoganii TaxID=553239 RepID=UPI00037F2BC6|nr:hypothetical protein [Vibrio breoganii]OED98145.1 hypothetical protein A1QG_11385 [Vibrio breoganii ZF-29]
MNSPESIRQTVEDFCDQFYEKNNAYPSRRELQEAVSFVCSSLSTCQKYFTKWKEARELRMIERLKLSPLSEKVALAFQEEVDRIVSQRIGSYESIYQEHSKQVDGLIEALAEQEILAKNLQKALDAESKQKAELEIRLRLSSEKDEIEVDKLKDQLLTQNRERMEEREEFHSLRVIAAKTEVEMKNLLEKHTDQQAIISQKSTEVEALKSELERHKKELEQWKANEK